MGKVNADFKALHDAASNLFSVVCKEMGIDKLARFLSRILPK